MSNDMAQTGLKEPERVDWDSIGATSKYQAPPPAIGPDGRPIVYYGQPVEVRPDENPDEGYLNYIIDFKITGSGNGADGLKMRTWASTRPYLRNGEPQKGNPNKLASYLKASGVAAKPQTNSEYQAAVQAAKTKRFPFTLDWEAKNRDTGETVKGYMSFPEDPDRPGYRKSVLRQGDTVTDRDRNGNVVSTRTVQSEVLFANARLRWFQDSAPRVAK